MRHYTTLFLKFEKYFIFPFPGFLMGSCSFQVNISRLMIKPLLFRDGDFHSLSHLRDSPLLTPAERMTFFLTLERFQASHHDPDSQTNSPDILSQWILDTYSAHRTTIMRDVACSLKSHSYLSRLAVLIDSSHCIGGFLVF
jgi:hypothetical protein